MEAESASPLPCTLRDRTRRPGSGWVWIPFENTSSRGLSRAIRPPVTRMGVRVVRARYSAVAKTSQTRSGRVAVTTLAH